MRLVIDVNLSPEWCDVLAESDIEAVHWSTVGPIDARDEVIMEYARSHEMIVFTHDLDFGSLLFLTQASRPSVVQLRSEDVRPSTMGSLVLKAIQNCATHLQTGALLTIDPRRNRVNLLPIGRQA